jgi:F-type H+-transporting ATPase subunit b
VSAFRRMLSLGCLAALLGIAAPSVIVTVAVAEEQHEQAAVRHEAAHHVPTVGDLLFPAINFAVYLAIIVRFVIPAMREYLRRRSADGMQLKAESEAALTRAERDLATSKARLSGLSVEADTIRQDLVAIATRQAERTKAQAEETGTRRLADAKLLAEQERRRALGSLRADLARAATDLAGRRLRDALTADDQRSFVQQFLKDAAAR